MKSIRFSSLKQGLSLTALTFFGLSCTSQMSKSVVDETAGLNGGFEVAKEGIPVNWLCYTQETTGSGKFNLYLNPNDRTEGKQSLSIDVQECSSKGGRYSPGLAKEFDVSPGKTYIIHFKAKQSTTQTKVNIHAVSAFQQSTPSITFLNEPIATWKPFSFEYHVPEDMSKLRLEINVLKPGQLQLDEVVIEEKLHSPTP